MPIDYVDRVRQLLGCSDSERVERVLRMCIVSAAPPYPYGSPRLVIRGAPRVRLRVCPAGIYAHVATRFEDQVFGRYERRAYTSPVHIKSVDHLEAIVAMVGGRGAREG